MNENGPEFQSVLDALSDPVLLVRDGLVIYRNEAAAQLLPELAAGELCPQPLAAAVPLQDDSGVAVCRIGGASCTVTSTAVSGATALVIRVLREDGAQSRRWALVFTKQIREQMSALLAAVQRIEEDVREGAARREDKWLAVLNQSAYRMLRTVSAVELEQALADGQAYRSATIDLAGLCHGLEREVAPLVRQMELTFSYESTEASLLTQGDEELLRTMLLGLISNAVKAAGPNGRLGLRLVRQGGKALISVWDDGPGIHHKLDSVFRKAQDEGVPSPTEGLGLSLLNANAIAALHGGLLVAASKEGSGARFTVSLPIKAPGGLQLRTPRQARDSHGGFSTLLVELSDALPWQVFLPEDLD